MKCQLCDGTGRLIKPWYDTTGLMTGFTGDICFMCDGTGEITEETAKKTTNFDRITASSEALAEFIHEAESVYERCAKGDLNCDYCECRWCGLAGRKDLIDWLNEECDNA